MAGTPLPPHNRACLHSNREQLHVQIFFRVSFASTCVELVCMQPINTTHSIVRGYAALSAVTLHTT